MKHYIGEVGLAIVLDCNIALASATVLKIKYLKPSGEAGEWIGSISGTTSIQYITQTSDIDEAGKWIFQAYAEVGAFKGPGATAEISFSAAFGQSALTDLNTVKDMLGLTDSQTNDDNLLEGLVTKETAFIQTACGRTFFYAEHTEYRDGDLQSSIMVDEYPIVSITSIHDDEDRAYGADTLIAATDYSFRAKSGIIELDSDVFSDGKQNVKVVYNGGYKVIPDDLALACAQRVVADYLELKGGMSAVVGEVVTYKPANLRAQAEKVIKLYRKSAK